MGQFDFDSAAALSRIKSEALSSFSAGKTSSRLLGIGSKLLELLGAAGAATLGDLIQDLKNLAVEKDEGNLIYFAEAFVSDLRRLYQLNEEMRKRVEEVLRSDKLDQAVGNATLHITRTNVQKRIARVALLIANGVKANDLEPESLDDLMRAAVELKDQDVVLLRKIYQSQLSLLLQDARRPGRAPDAWHQDIQGIWHGFVSDGGLNQREHLLYRSSLSRLESFGFIQHVSNAGMYGVGLDPYALLEEGRLFCERILEIAD